MKYFITGATGFVGGVLARQLREAGHEVRASVRSIEKAKDLQALGVKLFKGDVTDKESMREPMTGVDGVYHVAGWYKVGAHDKSGGEKVNVQGTRNVLELSTTPTACGPRTAVHVEAFPSVHPLGPAELPAVANALTCA